MRPRGHVPRHFPHVLSQTTCLVHKVKYNWLASEESSYSHEGVQISQLGHSSLPTSSFTTSL
jgi:hypothetical protein